jgi:hypothetical protein
VDATGRPVNATRVMLKDIILAYAEGLVKPRPFNGGEPRFGCTLLMPQDHPGLRLLTDRSWRCACAMQ